MNEESKQNQDSPTPNDDSNVVATSGNHQPPPLLPTELGVGTVARLLPDVMDLKAIDAWLREHKRSFQNG